MSTSWFSSFGFASDASQNAVGSASGKAIVEEEPPVALELTPEQRRSEKLSSMRSKLKEEMNAKPAQPGSHFTYERIFRPISRIITDAENAESGQEGIAVSLARQAMNSSISSKYVFHNTQQSAWDVTLQMHGFADSVAATYSTAGRYQLMYQRVLKMGGLAMGQWAVMPSMMMPGLGAGGVPAGNFFGMIEYPWRRHGCSILTYLKGRQVTLSHAERIIRGLHVGVSTTYFMDTHNTSNAYAVQAMSSDRKTTVALEVKDNGDVRLGCTRKDWGTDCEMAVEMDFTEKKNNIRASSFNVGLYKPLIGGGVLNICLLNYTKVRGMIELPFGLDRVGLNQMKISYSMLYDAKSSTMKHGLLFTV